MNILEGSDSLVSIFVEFVLIFMATLLGPAQPSLASQSSGNTSWELTKAFGEAMRYQELSNKRFIVLFLIILVILLGVIIVWYITQRRPTNTDKGQPQAWWNNDNSSNETQRAWMRLSINQDLLFSKDDNDNFQKGKIVNISGSGLLFATDQDIKLNDKLRILFKLIPNKKLNLTGKVVRVVESPAATKKSSLIGVEFININRGDQDSIISKILEIQQASMNSAETANKNHGK